MSLFFSVLSLSHTHTGETKGYSNGYPDRVRCGVPVLLVRLHQVPPPNSPSSLLPHLLKTIKKKKKSHMCWNLNFPAKTWNGLVRKSFYLFFTSFYKHLHVMGFCCLCFIVCTSVIFVCQVFVVMILSMFVALVWHDYIMEIDLFGCRPTPLVQEIVSVWFVMVEFIYLC